MRTVTYCHPEFGCDCGVPIEELENSVKVLTKMVMEKNEDIVALQHTIRELRHDIANEQMKYETERFLRRREQGQTNAYYGEG